MGLVSVLFMLVSPVVNTVSTISFMRHLRTGKSGDDLPRGSVLEAVGRTGDDYKGRESLRTLRRRGNGHEGRRGPHAGREGV